MTVLPAGRSPGRVGPGPEGTTSDCDVTAPPSRTVTGTVAAGIQVAQPASDSETTANFNLPHRGGHRGREWRIGPAPPADASKIQVAYFNQAAGRAGGFGHRGPGRDFNGLNLK